MSKPSYLGLLNSIAVNEAKGQVLLQTWADHTADEQLRATLEFVAIREGEHAWTFTKRLCELGYAVDETRAFQVFKDFDGLLACAASDASDAEKVALLAGDGSDDDSNDPFRGFFNDTSIDPQTGALLGRYIAEERDSGRRLRAEYDRVRATAEAAAADVVAAPTQNGHSNYEIELDEMRRCIAELQEDIAALRKKVKKLR